VKLSGENGLGLLARLRGDPFLKQIPVVFYTSVLDQATIKKALGLHIQNYLIKPFQDSKIHAEIAKSMTIPWRNLLFEEEKSFCAQMGFCTNTLKKMREKVIEEIERLNLLLPEAFQEEKQHAITEQIDTLKGDAEASGIWGVVEFCEALISKAEVNQWRELMEGAEELEFAKRIVFSHVHPEHLHEGFLSDDERKAKEEAVERSRWMDADVLRNGPLIQLEGIEATLDMVTVCPSVDSSCASFAMYADGQASNLSLLADVVCRDPGLTTEVLCAVNRIERDGMNSVDDPRTAVSLLGELRLSSLAKSFSPIEDRHLQVPPFTWPHYWMYLMGVAHIARRTCEAMEFKLLEGPAFTAGLIHDIGKLLLSHMHPFALPAILQHSRQCEIPLQEAERRFLSTTTRSLTSRWAASSALSQPFKSVLTWVESPLDAKADQELVAAVSLARLLAMHNHIGHSGENPKDQCPSIEQTPAWQVLREYVFPSFKLEAFERDIHAYSHSLRQELLGRAR